MPENNLNRAFQWAINTCNAPNIGYSQDYRYQQTVDGITYYDCSSFIWYALQAGGFDLAGVGSYSAFTTSDMDYFLTRLGFTSFDTFSQPSLAGDIVWKTGHTEMVYAPTDQLGYNYTMGAHGRKNRPLADQVSILDYTRHDFTRSYRWGSGGATGYGLSLNVIAAICGNWWQESNINPGIWENLTVGAPGYGLGQWTDNSEVHRKTDLFNYLDEHGYARDSAEGQLAFFIEENIWYKTGYASQFNSLEEFLQSNSDDLETLTYAFMQGWEGIWDGTQAVRYVAAQVCRNYIQAHANDSSINHWISGNFFLTNEGILNNAVMLYRYLSVGGGGGTGIDVKKMPVWMKIRYW